MWIFFFVLVLVLLLIVYAPGMPLHRRRGDIREHYYNTPTEPAANYNCPGCSNYSNYLHLNDDCYLKHLYNVKQTNLLAKIYEDERFCGLGYIQS